MKSLSTEGCADTCNNGSNSTRPHTAKNESIKTPNVLRLGTRFSVDMILQSFLEIFMRYYRIVERNYKWSHQMQGLPTAPQKCNTV